MEIDLHIEGMTCAACSTRIERVLNKIPGVVAQVSLIEHRARISGLPVDDAIAAIRRAGYDAWPSSATPTSTEHDATQSLTATRLELFRLWCSGIGLLVMMVEMVGMLLGQHGLIPIAAQWVIATVMQTIVAWPFYRSAWRALKAWSANMETLITIGSLAAYFWSVALWLELVDLGATSDGLHGVFYFETSVVVLAMVTLGKRLEQRARQQALDALAKLTSMSTTLVSRWDKADGTWKQVDPNTIGPGDRLRIPSGEAIHVDGLIIDGMTDIDESSMTGESMPVSKSVGDAVYAGCLNTTGTIIIDATSRFDNSRRAQIGSRLLAALSSRAPIAALADRIAFWFVPAVLVIATISGAAHLLMGAPASVAVSITVAVLVVACPCALGLATPAAIAAGLARATQFGWLFKSAEALERAAKISHVVFDKTGTLTSGRPMILAIVDRQSGLVQITEANSPWPDWLAAAASAERGIEHPLAGALLSYAAGRPLPPIRSSEQIPGKGVIARLDDLQGREVLVGSPDWIRSICAVELQDSFPDAIAIDVVIDRQWQGRCWIADRLRSDAPTGLAMLRSHGVEVEILSGDRKASVARIAQELGGIRYLAQANPEMKSQHLDQHRQAGRQVAMVGDGFNDATAMAHASLGIAMANGARLTLETADLTMTSRAPVLATAQSLLFAKVIMRRVRENLGFAFGFNVLAIPLAMTGLLAPSIAATAMALSSAAVMTNAARLLRWTPPTEKE